MRTGRNRAIINVIGPSGSGKSSRCRALHDLGLAFHLRLDHFYLGVSDQSPPRIRHPQTGELLLDWESPEAIDLPAAAEVLRQLASGADSVEIPEYDRSTHRRTERRIRLNVPSGIPVLCDSLFGGESPLLSEANVVILFSIRDQVTLERRRMRQGDGYTDEYHQHVMIPSLEKRRKQWEKVIFSDMSVIEFNTEDFSLTPQVEYMMGVMIREVQKRIQS